MSNQNRISYELSTEKAQRINDLFAELEQEISEFAQSLSPAQRRKGPNMNVDNQVFTEDAITVLKNPTNQAWLPPFLNAEETRRDLQLFRDLEPALNRALSVWRALRDTQMLAGQEAASTAFSTYRLADLAAKQGLTGAQEAYNLLKARFLGSPSLDDADQPRDTETSST